ncbi:PREDICTED: uncharacterized protein LOC105564129 isoform X3 [Vollenhovia emeryi]|uniref:uncharacterized protein LOC105564129 isoform X3 n=1 Tax=Vollenhovia emeryi TaxID=411798 RepID=UPI0005F379AD|nr:PREDICTED: uncharacterized protein LOC105564129 isoform X3 [Vollenhovia emeryi]
MLRTLDVELKQTRMLSNFLREYNINRLFLSTVGFWPFQSKHLRNSLRIFSFLLEISYCPFEILLLYDHWDDAQMIFEGCYQNLISMYLIVNQLNEFWNHDKFRQLYKIIDEHWNIFTNDKEIQILKEYSTLSRIFTKYYFISLYIMLLIFTTIPLTPLLLDIVMPLNESRPRFFALVAEYRVDINEYFLPIFCYTTAVIVVAMNITLSVNTLMRIVCISHACSLFVAVRFVDMLDSSQQVVSLVTLLVATIGMSLLGMRILYVKDQLSELVRSMSIMTGALVTILIICYSGQKLMDESENIFHRTLTTEWYNFSPRLKSLLIITLYRSSVPCGLKLYNNFTCVRIKQLLVFN